MKEDVVHWLNRSAYPYVLITSRPHGISEHLNAFRKLQYKVRSAA